MEKTFVTESLESAKKTPPSILGHRGAPNGTIAVVPSRRINRPDSVES